MVDLRTNTPNWWTGYGNGCTIRQEVMSGTHQIQLSKLAEFAQLGIISQSYLKEILEQPDKFVNGSLDNLPYFGEHL